MAALVASGEFESPRECADGFAAIRAMAESAPDLVICDLVMPGCDGIQFLRLVGGTPELARIPILVLTAAEDPDSKVELLERGAADYVTKPLRARELIARARIHCRHRLLQEALEDANRRLYELSCTDGLTGTFNRRHLDEALTTEVSRHQRYRTPLSVLLIDVDHFKRVNDTHGHDVGDSVLRGIASLLQGMVRRADLVARYGGEEMCVILPNTGSHGAAILAGRLRAAIAALRHATSDGEGIVVTASFGVTTVETEDTAVDAATMLRRADKALYAAKQGGRNRVETWPITG